MSKKTVSNQGQVGVQSTFQNGIVHPYVLNDSKAIKVMMTNAKLPPANVGDQTAQTTKLQLSTGAFSQVIFPLFNYWQQFNLDQGQRLIAEGTEVTLKEARVDTEENGKKVDGLAKFTFKDENISLHMYCTNQHLMIQGFLHSKFLDMFIGPLLQKNIYEKMEEIINFNTKVTNALIPNDKTNRNDSVTPERGRTNMILRKTIPCEDCGKKFPDTNWLIVHVTNVHNYMIQSKPKALVKNCRQFVSTVNPSAAISLYPQHTPLTVISLLDEIDESDDQVEIFNKGPY